MLDYKFAKLSNGLRVITAPLKNTRAVSILFLIGSGSRWEKEKESGIAHFLEHMLFKGTRKRPKTVDIARELDAVGAQYNAFTSEEATGFYVRVESSHFDLGTDVLTDMLQNSLLDEKEIAKEKGVIFEEINMVKDIPQAYVDEVMKELLWPNHPLGRMVLGSRETVSKFSQKDFLEFLSLHYQPENMIVVISGNGDEKKWIEQIQKKLDKIKNKKTENFVKTKNSQNFPRVKIFHKETDQAHFILGFRSFKRTDPHRPIFKVLNNIMGDTMSSRLFIEVREKRGLCYYVSSDLADYIDAGFWGVSAGADIKRMEEALQVILSEIENLKMSPVSDEELSQAKENLKGHLYLGLEESLSVAQFLGEQEMFWKKIEDPDKIVNDYRKVTKEEIKELANDIFIRENLNLAIVGPFKEEEKFLKIMEEFK